MCVTAQMKRFGFYLGMSYKHLLTSPLVEEDFELNCRLMHVTAGKLEKHFKINQIT